VSSVLQSKSGRLNSFSRLNGADNKAAVRPVMGNAVLVAVSEKVQTRKGKFGNAVRGQGQPGVQAVFYIEIDRCKFRVTRYGHDILSTV
jgi:hypothetical protein